MEVFFDQVAAIYEGLAQNMDPFMQAALCRPGCSLCCSGPGRIDISTLEGLKILQHINSLPSGIRQKMWKSVARDCRNREQEKKTCCPFLRKNHTCAIYEIRPLVCRRLYSLEPCKSRGAVLHKEAVALGAEARDALQRLDINGYSGHISYILHLLEEPGFRSFYAAGGFDPSLVMVYGRKHKLVIHRSLHGKK
ncbi:YkgJ family cysteine cluster protein [Desulfobotulus sp. H1]|uniref:YkgJ family cysteine cluster protein n=1 Tax=Desulfobotulus pelophilus TaxID=2823377 RepID=A0ABT3NAR7_9BACT|nr:YkgJ family cysteine cluster protein [Desulfobotulus pelophilus]MCW7754549.1 YkgJ family cysteine cluster protein [Desulfobotulus pelophilus]